MRLLLALLICVSSLSGSMPQVRTTTQALLHDAYQAWAKDFGWRCPVPDFEGARTFSERRIESWLTRTAGSIWRHFSLVVIVVVLVAFLGVAIWRMRLLTR